MAAIAVSVVLLGAACASTNQRSSLVAQDAVAAAAGADDSSLGEAPPSAEGATEVRTRVAGGGASGEAAGPSTRAQLVGKGVTDTEIRVGLQVAKNLGATIRLLGATTTTGDNLVGQVRAVESWINANGGVAGRTLRVVVHETDPTAGTFAAQSQQACVAFTEDNEVLMAATMLANLGPDLASCLAQNDTSVLAQNYYPYDEADYRSLGAYLHQSSRWEANRWHRAYVDGLAAQGFFDNSKLGLVRFDGPVYDRIAANSVRPRLKELGIELVEEIAVRRPGEFADFASMSGEINNAILRFKSAGVDRVMFMEEAGAIFFFWLPAAQSSGYYPRYGLNSGLTPYLHALNHPRAMRGAVGVGWVPILDTNTQEDADAVPGWPKCLEIMRESGQWNPETPWSGSFECDSLFFMKDVLDRAADLTPSGIRQAVGSLGESFDSALTFGTRYSPSRHWGVSKLRNFAFDEGLGRFKYVGDFYTTSD